MKKLLITFALLLIGTSTHAAGWIVFQKVYASHTANGEIHLKIDISDASSPCTWKNTYAIQKTHPEFEEMKQYLLLAQVTGSPGRVFGTGQCEIEGYKQIASKILLGTW